jgi:hypothetical protein
MPTIATVIHNNRGYSALRSWGGTPVFFFLQAALPKWGIFGVSVAFNADVEPSGEVPSVDNGGCGFRSRLKSVGGEGLDDFFSSFKVGSFC